MAKRKRTPKSVETIKHEDATRKHIPTAEYQAVLNEEQKTPLQVAYERRNRDLDPQLVWRGKDMQDWSDLVVQAPPLYIQEKVHPKVLIDDLRKQTEAQEEAGQAQQFDMFADFNGLPSEEAKTEFYEHDANWSNRMILGDSLQVMASLAEREGLRGKVQMIYLDPPYGIKFNSNFQWSTTNRNVKETFEHITREPEQVKAFRDTWRDGVHSYLTYLKDRLTVARDLLHSQGSVFIQISDENIHRVRLLLDEIFGPENFVSQITYRTKNMTFGAKYLETIADFVLWYAKDKEQLKYRQLFRDMVTQGDSHWNLVEFSDGHREKMSRAQIDSYKLLPPNAIDVCQLGSLYPAGINKSGLFPINIFGKEYYPPRGKSWKTNPDGLRRAFYANRIESYKGGETIRYVMRVNDYPVSTITSLWDETPPPSNKKYVVETAPTVIQRCMLMATDPGDLVIDPTCGSGTSVYVAEQWGRRWITIDTSRVALALARSRIMGARYPYYVLKDSKAGQLKEAEISRTLPSDNEPYGNIRQGFVNKRVPHITLRAIAHNAEVDVIWETFQEKLELLREGLNAAVEQSWEEWQIPREAEEGWSKEALAWHKKWWEIRIERQKEIDASIAAKADYEYLYDKPYEDKKKVRVAGPFTVESLSPHRILGVDEDDELIDHVAEGKAGYAPGQSFEQMILENLKRAGVQQAHKEDKVDFFSLTPWPGHYIAAEGRYFEGGKENGKEKRAGIFIGPEFGTVARPDLVAAAREAGEAGFDVLIACAFNFDARSTEFSKLGAIPVLKARMNADLHMADDLKNTGKGNLFVIFGEPDIDILDVENDQIKVKINGVDVFHPGTGEVRSDGAEGIAVWFIDTDYNEESFFVRHAYFLGANDPYKSLKTTLKAEINAEAWATLNSDISRPFEKPVSGRIAVKVINHLGDEVMKVFRVN